MICRSPLTTKPLENLGSSKFGNLSARQVCQRWRLSRSPRNRPSDSKITIKSSVSDAVLRSGPTRLYAPYGGEGGIRTHGGREPSRVFKTLALNRSATSPTRAGQWPSKEAPPACSELYANAAPTAREVDTNHHARGICRRAACGAVILRHRKEFGALNAPHSASHLRGLVYFCSERGRRRHDLCGGFELCGRRDL